MNPRRVRVRSWKGPTPVVGDQLRSTRGRYLIMRIELDPHNRPVAFVITPVKAGEVTGITTTHPWVWFRGRHRTKRTS